MRLRSPILFLLFLAFTSSLHGSVALLVEEPYGTFGHMNPTGHAAVYFSNICAETPTQLRACRAGESGVVISRYSAIRGYDWVAIPLLPYLYAVETPDQVPASADAAKVERLRNQYRRAHLRAIVPDNPDGSAPDGRWEELVGAAFIRRIYVFQIESLAEQDAQLMALLNSRPNRSQFNLLFHNCADFSRNIINFYYPKALHRNLVADAGISTPKQMAKTLVRYSRKHPKMELSKFVIPQVPGTLPRSEAVHGVLESIVRSKKYAVPLLLLHPFIGSSVAVAYVADGRFNPARGAALLKSPAELQETLTADSRREPEQNPVSGTQDSGMQSEDGSLSGFHD